MLTFFSLLHEGHAPDYEFYRGERVPCFESPSRARFVQQELEKRGHSLIEPTVDSHPILLQIHTERYLTFLESAWSRWLAVDPANASSQPFPSVWPVRSLRSDCEPDNFIAQLGLYSMDNGSPMIEGTWAAAKAGADAAASAAEQLASGVESLFCATRPPGHHAGADFMGGYCFLNNAAVAAQGLRNSGCDRVAILDVDFHHGNGTQSIFYDRSDVLFVSIHGDPRSEYPFYLGYADEMGEGLGAGFNLNLPLSAGSTTKQWFDALEAASTRIIQYQADALVVSLGLDTFVEDPISKFALQSEDFSKLGLKLKQMGLPTLFILEGGYATKSLGFNAVNVLDAFENG